MATPITKAGGAVHSMATAKPEMMFVAGPVTEAAAIVLTGR